MKTVLIEENWAKKPGENYDHAFKANIEIVIDIPGETISDEEYAKVMKAIRSIRRTLAPYKKIASERLARLKKQEEAKK